MSDNPNAPADLSNMEMDLSQIFRPSWTVESSPDTARLAAKYDDDNHGDYAEHRGGKRHFEGKSHRQDRRQQGGEKNRATRDSRNPRHQGDGGGDNTGQGGYRGAPSGAPQRSSGSQRDERSRVSARDPRDRRSEHRGREDRRPESAPKPTLEGWKISLIPEHPALEAISKQIRSRAKAYPLFELARLIVNLSDRYSVKLQADSEESPKLFRVKADGSLWTSQKQAVNHLLSKHLEKFYSQCSVAVEAPKGNYSVVAQCGMSGVLLGPSNHHAYQSRLMSLHATRFKNLPFEVYKTRIKMMRDDTLVEQWKSEQSTRTIFIPIDPSSQVVREIEKASVAAEPPELSSEVHTQEAVASPKTTEEAPQAETLPVAEASSEESAAAAPVADGPQLSREEVTEHFHKNHAENEIEEAASQIIVSGRIALHESDPLLHELLIKTLQELDRFPLPLAQIVGKELAGNGLQIFKTQKKIIHVSVARPHYLDCSTTPTSEGFRNIIEYLEAHPNQHRDKQWAGLLSLRTEPAGDDDVSVKQREQSLGTDLLWLLHQGHVIDFAMGNLQAAPRPVAKPTAPAPTSNTTSAPAETPFLG